ncbi:MAG: hypothetical protein ACK4NR_01860 [Micavibrio sp.]
MSFMNPAAIQAQGISADFSAGSVKIGIDNDGCDASKEGAIRYYSVASLHQFCNGVGWAGFFANPPNVVLAITPSSNLGMDVTGPGNPAYGANQIFTVRNFGKNPSEVLGLNLNDPGGNFEVVSDACTGIWLGENETCDITIRALATDNGPYEAVLTIPHDNMPTAYLRGIGTYFGCIPGDTGGGGIYVSCGVSYNLVTTPGGCNDSATPACPGSADSVTKLWGSYGQFRDGVSETQDGPQNNVNLMGYVAQEGNGAHPAAEYCMNMSYGGYDDWYLPSNYELMALYANRALLSGWQTAIYWSSTQVSNNDGYFISTTGTVSNTSKATLRNVRCVRRETQALPAFQPDVTPDQVFFVPVMTTAGNRVTSNSVTVTSVSADISVSLNNDSSGGARLKINGGAEVTGGTVGYGDTIELVMTAPASAGSANMVELVLGNRIAGWRVGVPDATGTRRVFVSESSNGAIGGIWAANARCQSEADAAGLTGSWIAIISESTSTNDLAAIRMDFNWATLNNMNGELVASGWNDLWDGTISNPIRYDEYGALVSTNTSVYTGTGVAGVPTSTSTDCTRWISSSSSISGTAGIITGTGNNWIQNSQPNCSTQARLYCFEQVNGAGDTTPSAFEFNPMTAQAAAGTTDVTSAGVVVSGMDDGVSVSISGTGNPEYRINAGGWTSAPGTINDGDTLTIRADAPPTNGARHKVAITVGSYTTYWYVGAGDTGITRRVFLTSTTAAASVSIGLQDARCVAAAQSRGLGPNWVSLMSDDNVDGYAVNRAPVSWGTLVDLNGNVVASDWNDLWDGSIDRAINLTELGSTVSGSVWTGSDAYGRGTGLNCLGWSSTSTSHNGTAGSSGTSGSGWLMTTLSSNCSYTGNLRTYCIESADNPADTYPDPFYYNPMTTQGTPSATDVTGGAVTITGINTTVPVSVSGAGNPEYRINAGGWTNVSGTIGNGDVLTIRADAPAAVNQRNKVNVTVGDYTTTWYVGAGNTANTKRIFVTSTSTNGAINGVGGADSICAARASAAGLGTAWKALISDSKESQYAVNRVPLNWGTLQNMNGGTVATSWNDLWDGNVSGLPNYNENGVLVSTNVWTGSLSNGRPTTNTCLDWSSNTNSSTYSTGRGISNFTNQVIYLGTVTCNNSHPLYCVEE